MAPAGFTLLDLMLVIVILGILAGAGLPAMESTLVKYHVDAAADQITQAFEYAQASAITGGCEMRVSLDVATEIVRIEKARTSNRISDSIADRLTEEAVETRTFTPVEHPLKRGSDYVFRLSDQGWLGDVDLTKAVFGADHWITFDARGRPSSGGTVELTESGQGVQLVIDGRAGTVTRVDL